MVRLGATLALTSCCRLLTMSVKFLSYYLVDILDIKYHIAYGWKYLEGRKKTEDLCSRFRVKISNQACILQSQCLMLTIIVYIMNELIKWGWGSYLTISTTNFFIFLNLSRRGSWGSRSNQWCMEYTNSHVVFKLCNCRMVKLSHESAILLKEFSLILSFMKHGPA